METLTKSPYNKNNAVSVPEAVTTPIRSRSVVPDIGSDLVASQTKSPTGTAAVISESMKKGGSLLRAIRNKTASLNAMLRVRSQNKTRKSMRSRH
jgi:hypothetical protein